MKKILCVVGPTGTGKTAKALELARSQPSIIISADSRQVYKGMDIVTGKDHPKSIEIIGVDIVEPDELCSVAVWYDSVMPHLTVAWKEGKLPIVVGGTGLYVKAITSGIDTMQVPINQSLRNRLNMLSITELQASLARIDSAKFESMNHSDKLNPRRLIRAIEVVGHEDRSEKVLLDSEVIGLRNLDELSYRNIILSRVRSRLEQGAVEETNKLLLKYGKNIQSLSAIGYKSIIRFIEKNFTEEEMVDNWVRDELYYAKRQMTWFRKQSVIWYDVGINKE